MKKKNMNLAEELSSKLKTALHDTPSAQMEEFSIPIPSSDGEGEFETMLVDVAADFFRKDNPNYRIRHEVVYNDNGRLCGMRCELWLDRNDPNSVVADGFAEAVTQGNDSLPMATAARRARKEALKAAGYDVPSWKKLQAALEPLLNEEGEFTTAQEAIEAAQAMISGVEEDITPIATAPEKPKKRRGRKPKAAAATVEVSENFDPGEVPAINEQDIKESETATQMSLEEPAAEKANHADAVKEMPVEKQEEPVEEPAEEKNPEHEEIEEKEEPAQEEPVKEEPKENAAETNSTESGSIWDSIPDTGLTQEEVISYLGKITEEDIANFKVPYGRVANMTVGEVATGSSKHLLRAYANNARCVGTKFQVAVLKACEVYGL